MEKASEEYKEKISSLTSIRNTLQNDLLALQSLLDQEKSTNVAIFQQLHECDAKRVSALNDNAILKEREQASVNENTRLQALLNQLEKVNNSLFFFSISNKKIFNKLLFVF